jgi:hypothetical protein
MAEPADPTARFGGRSVADNSRSTLSYPGRGTVVNRTRSVSARVVPSDTLAPPAKLRSKPIRPLRITWTRTRPASVGVSVAARRSGAPVTKLPTSDARRVGRIRTMTSFDLAESHATWKGRAGRVRPRSERPSRERGCGRERRAAHQPHARPGTAGARRPTKSILCR